MEENEQAIAEFMETTSQDRRTALYYLQRRHGDVNNAVDDYFNNFGASIPDDFMPESTSSNRSGSRIMSSPSISSSSTSSSSDSDFENEEDSHSHIQPSPMVDADSVANIEVCQDANETELQQISVIEVDSAALLSKESISITEKDDDIDSSVMPFPKQKSKGKSDKIFLYSNGILFQEKFYDKSSTDDYNKIMKCLSCGYFPPDLAPGNLVDIEIINLHAQNYSKWVNILKIDQCSK